MYPTDTINYLRVESIIKRSLIIILLETKIIHLIEKKF